MKTKEQVIEWLKSKEWFEQFKANVEKVHSVERFLDWFYGYTMFFAAFDWADTPEGNVFWYKKCCEFMNWWNNEND